MKPTTIDAFHAGLDISDRRICDKLRELIDTHLPDAEGRMWHAHPVWFLEGNPIVGYSKLKDSVRLMFWSGQSFETPGLEASGSFKAAETRFTEVEQIDADAVLAWLSEAPDIQWDYKNIAKRKGRLERLQ